MLVGRRGLCGLRDIKDTISAPSGDGFIRLCVDPLFSGQIFKRKIEVAWHSRRLQQIAEWGSLKKNRTSVSFAGSDVGVVPKCAR